MVFVAATNNAGKLEEIERLLIKHGHTAVTLKDVGFADDIEESGNSFAQNALLKAQTVCNFCGLPTIADDSGLEVDCLGGAPGVHTARYAKHGDDEANIDKLLHVMEGVPAQNRGAKFVSAVCLYMPTGRALIMHGECAGEIGTVRSGANGFGYDPVFYINGRSFADFEPQEKDAVSHRAKALAALETQLAAFLPQINK